MSKALPGNRHSTDTHTYALDLLRDALGATVIATYPNARAPLPDTGPYARCGATTTRYGPGGSPHAPAADRPATSCSKHPHTPSRGYYIGCQRAFRERVNRPE
jgi:hypothetical protein